MARRKILMIGLDAADKDLLIEWSDQGRLPTFQKLREQGAWGIAESPPGFGSGAIWPCFFTGVSPARHGRYFYRQIWPGHYGAERFEAEHFQARTIWEVLSDAGRHVAVFDVPKAGLSEDLHGIQAVDWLVHGPVYKKLVTWPPGFADELAGKFGTDPMPQCDHPGGRNAQQHEALRDLLVDRVRQKEIGSEHYWKADDWDFFLTVFADPHCVGHQCWHVRDPRHPAFDAEAAALVGDPVFDVYAAIDAAIGRMIDGADEDTVVLVVSATGMGPNYTGNFVLDEILRRLEGTRKTRSLDWLGRLKRLAKRALPIEMRKRGRQLSRRVEERVSEADRLRRRCFTVPHNDIAGAIRVNLAGREPQGRVRPDEVDALYRSLRRDLLEVRNLETGEPIVEDVVRTADHCHGAHLGDLPEFFVLWRRDAPIERVGSPKIGEITYRHRGNRTGDHVSDSIFFARGPGVRPGRTAPVSIMDFAPTIARLAGVAWDDGDGRPIEAVSGDAGATADRPASGA